MAQRSANVLDIDDRVKQVQVFKALNDEIEELKVKEAKVDDDLQNLVKHQDEFIDDERHSLTSLSNLKDQLTWKKMQIKYLNEKINDARERQDHFYEQLYQYRQIIIEKCSLNELNADLISKTNEENSLDEEYQLLLEQLEDTEKQIEKYQQKLEVYEIDFKSNEERLVILQSNIKNLEQDLEDYQEKKESNEKNLSELREKLIKKRNEIKEDEKQRRVLNEQCFKSIYSKTFLEELIQNKQILAKKEDSPSIITRIQNELDQLPISFKHQVEEIDNRRSIISNEIKMKQTSLNHFKKDLETLTTTTMDFTTSSTMSM